MLMMEGSDPSSLKTSHAHSVMKAMSTICRYRILDLVEWISHPTFSPQVVPAVPLDQSITHHGLELLKTLVSSVILYALSLLTPRCIFRRFQKCKTGPSSSRRRLDWYKLPRLLPLRGPPICQSPQLLYYIKLVKQFKKVSRPLSAAT